MPNEKNSSSLHLKIEAGARPKMLEASKRALVRMIGADAQDLLHRISTNDFSNLRPGEVQPTVLTSDKGRIIEVLAVVKRDEAELLLLGHSNDGVALKGWLEKFIIMEDVRVEEVGPVYSHYMFFEAEDFVKQIGMDESQHRKVQTDMSFFGLGGGSNDLWIFETWSKRTLIHLLLEKQGRELGSGPVPEESYFPSSEADYDKFRVQCGIPESPRELSSRYNPLEAGLTSLISFTKGCYVGQEVIARLDTYGKVQRKLVRVKTEDSPDLLPTTIYTESEGIGEITTCVQDEKTGAFAGLAYVRISFLQTPSDSWIRRGEKRIPLQILRIDSN